MATAAKRAVLQTAFTTLSVRGLRRRRLGHIGPNHLSNELDKWGRRKDGASTNNGYGNNNGLASNLLAGGRRPAPRASLVLGGGPPRISRRKNETAANGLNGNNGSANLNGGNNGLVSKKSLVEQQRSMARGSRGFVNGTPPINGIVNHNADDRAQQSNQLNGSSSASSSSNINTNDPQEQQDNNASTKTTNGSSGSRYTSDLIVVLDMDECLIHSQFLSDQMVDKYRQHEDRPDTRSSPYGQNEEAIMWQTCDSFRINLPDGDLVNVNKRPNLDLFLGEITDKFETYIFTAAMEVYAAPVLNKLDPKGNRFAGRFYREHCVYDHDLGVYAKDLCEVMRSRKMLINGNDDNKENEDDDCSSCDQRRVVLVDNNPLSFLPNPSNGILVSSFYDDPKDDTLEAVMELLHELDECGKDVRPILEDRFGLRDALDDVVKGASLVGW